MAYVIDGPPHCAWLWLPGRLPARLPCCLGACCFGLLLCACTCIRSAINKSAVIKSVQPSSLKDSQFSQRPVCTSLTRNPLSTPNSPLSVLHACLNCHPEFAFRASPARPFACFPVLPPTALCLRLSLSAGCLYWLLFSYSCFVWPHPSWHTTPSYKLRCVPGICQCKKSTAERRGRWGESNN